jgi:hypothetical protein
MASATPNLNPQDFNEGQGAAERFRDLTRRILTTPKAQLVKGEAPTKKQPPKKK